VNYNNRLLFIGFLITIYFIIVTFVLFHKSLLHDDNKHHTIFKNVQINKLPKIYDRNGFLLATTLPTASIYANTKKIINPKDAAKKLNKLFPNLSEQYFYKKLTSGDQFTWIKKHLTPKEQLEFLYLGIPGIYIQNDAKRVYITENLFAHVLGYVNSDNVGIAGFEHYLTKLSDYNKDNITLTVDARIQHILKSEIQKTIDHYDAYGGAGIVLDANTGEIIALTSLPDFNPNYQQFASNNEKFNRASLGVYEFGSIMKIFTLAAGLDSKSISIHDEFDVSSPIIIDKYTIQDLHKPKKPIYSINEVLQHSSNIGMAKIVLRSGSQVQKEYFEKMQFSDQLKIQIPEKSVGITPKKYNELTAITISYGYGLSTTFVHVAQAMAALINESGKIAPATLFKSSEGISTKIISDDTRKMLRDLLLEVVKNGTGRKAKSKEYNIGGKSGSAEKSQNGGYNKKLNISSFVAAFPIEKPKYIIAIMIDEPRSEGFVTGGIVVAPIMKKVIERIGPILNIEPIG
jgi:cell division protein FtsI (penicillin-binding protein 3)